MEQYFVLTKAQRDALMQYVSEAAKHRPFEEVSKVIGDLARLPEAQLPNEDTSDGE